MPIIFGWGRETVKKIGVVVELLCNHCHNREFWILARKTSWFTLFFIPIIPYSTKYFMFCPVCEYGALLDQEQIERLEPLAEANQLLIEGRITKEEHQEKIRRLSGNVSVPAKIEVIEKKELVAAESKLRFCVNCGVSIAEEAKFCKNCGKEKHA